MKYFARALSVGVISILLCSCASEGVRPVDPLSDAKLQSVPTTRAKVVIYREGRSLGALLSPMVTVNGKDLVNVGNGKVFVGAFKPGHYIFESNDKNSGTEVDLKAGGSIYIKMEIVAGMWKGNGKLLQVAPEQGAFEAKRLKLVSPHDIEDPTYR